jgi:short-subunit dehydrogenase
MNGFYESFSKELNPDWNIHLMIAEPALVKTDFLDRNVTAIDRHPAYLDPKCATNQLLDMFKQSVKAQEVAGTPEDLVQVVLTVITDKGKEGAIPLRLPLGADAFQLIDASLRKQLKDNQAIKSYAESFVGLQGRAMEAFDDLV